MKVLYRTDTARTTSSDMHDGKTHEVDAWFEVQLHEGPAAATTWEGRGKTIGEWREEFKRLRDPRRITFPCHGADSLAEAVVPNEVLDALQSDARISFVWTVCMVREPLLA